jgi:hypothetical protein
MFTGESFNSIWHGAGLDCVTGWVVHGGSHSPPFRRLGEHDTGFVEVADGLFLDLNRVPRVGETHQAQRHEDQGGPDRPSTRGSMQRDQLLDYIARSDSTVAISRRGYDHLHHWHEAFIWVTYWSSPELEADESHFKFELNLPQHQRSNPSGPLTF